MKTFILAAIGMAAVLFSMNSNAQSSPLVITAPANGTVVAPGQTIAVSVNVKSGTYPSGVAIVGGQAGGHMVGAGPLSGSLLSFSLTIPMGAHSGPLSISALGKDSSGTLDTSTAITLDVEQSGSPVSLRVDPPSIHFHNVGQSLSLTVIGVYADGTRRALTQSSLLQITSSNAAIAAVQKGSIEASGPGNTDIQVSYGSLRVSVPVYVPR